MVQLPSDTEATMAGNSPRLLEKIRRLVTVEPAAFLFDMVFMLLLLTDEQYVYARMVELDAMGLANTSLDANTSMAADHSQIAVEASPATKPEADAASFMTVYWILYNLPGVFLVFLWGSYSDSVGRKRALIVPVLGSAIHVLTNLLVSSMGLDVNILYCGCFIDGLFGGPPVFRGAIFAYISDITDYSNRSQRTALLQAVIVVGLAVSQLTSGYAIQTFGFFYTYIFAAFTISLCLVNVTCWVGESVSDPVAIPFCRWEHVKATLSMYVRDDGTETLWKLQVGLAVLFVANFVTGGVFPMLILFLISEPLCFSATLLGGFLALCNILGAFGAVATLYVCYSYLGDDMLLVMSCVSAVVGYTWLAMPFLTAPLVFLMAVVFALSFGITPLTRAILSKATSSDTQGALSAGLVFSIEVSILLGNATFGPIYTRTASLYRGSVWIVAACLLLLPVLLSGYLAWRNKKQHSANVSNENTRLT